VNRHAFAIVGPLFLGKGAKCIGLARTARSPRASPGAETDTVLEFFVAHE
jgi:hypothetical protein